MNKILATFLLLTLLAVPARAWNARGHKTVAELAWRQLPPETRQTLSEILQHHPHFEQILLADIPPGADTNHWAYLTASTWPDRVRPARKGQPPKPHSITKYNQYPHGIGYPFLWPGETNRALLETFVISQPDAEVVLSNSLATLKNPDASPHDRAVSLGWVLHLFGDLHQPLHTATAVTATKPKGDGLGGDYIILDPQRKEVNLHTFWDQLPGEDASLQGISALANQLNSEFSAAPDVLKEYQANRDIHQWVLESHLLAVRFALHPDHISFAHADALNSGQTPRDSIPSMSPEHARQARTIALRRLFLASKRLTDQLSDVTN